MFSRQLPQSFRTNNYPGFRWFRYKVPSVWNVAWCESQCTIEGYEDKIWRRAQFLTRASGSGTCTPYTFSEYSENRKQLLNGQCLEERKKKVSIVAFATDNLFFGMKVTTATCCKWRGFRNVGNECSSSTRCSRALAPRYPLLCRLQVTDAVYISNANSLFSTRYMA